MVSLYVVILLSPMLFTALRLTVMVMFPPVVVCIGLVNITEHRFVLHMLLFTVLVKLIPSYVFIVSVTM